MGAGASVDQTTIVPSGIAAEPVPLPVLAKVNENSTKIKAAYKASLGEKHWRDELKLYKLESIITSLELLGCRTNEDVLGLPNHIWAEIQLKLKLLDQKRFNHLREKFVVRQHLKEVESAKLTATATVPSVRGVTSPVNSISNSTTNSTNNFPRSQRIESPSLTYASISYISDNEDDGVDLPVYPENTAGYEVIVKQMALLKEDIAHITDLIGNTYTGGKFASSTSFVLRNGLIHSKALLVERMERCKARRTQLEVSSNGNRSRLYGEVGNNVISPRSIAASPRTATATGVSPRRTTVRNTNIRSNNSSRSISPMAGPGYGLEGIASSSGTNTPMSRTGRGLKKQPSNKTMDLSESVSILCTNKTVTFDKTVKVTCGKGTTTTNNYYNKITNTRTLTRQNSF